MLRKVRQVPKYTGRWTYSLLQNALNWAYGLGDPEMRRTALRSFYFLMQGQTFLNECRRGAALICRGKSAIDGSPLAVAMIGYWAVGQHNTLPYFQHQFFQDGECEVEDLGPYTNWQARRQAEAVAGQVDLVAMNINDWQAWKPEHGDWVYGPFGLRMVFDYLPGEEWNDAVKRMRHHNANIQRARNAGFTYRISHDEEDFHYFYQRLHLPMVKERHREYGDIIHEDGLVKVFHDNGLLGQVVDENGEVVGGVFQYVKAGVLYALLNGVLDGSPELIKRGVLTATYYYSMKWGFEQGLRHYDTGLCPSSLYNGIYQHKRRWGCRPEPNWWRPYSLFVWAPDCAPAAIDWMKAYPILPSLAHWGGETLTPFYDELVATRAEEDILKKQKEKQPVTRERLPVNSDG